MTASRRVAAVLPGLVVGLMCACKQPARIETPKPVVHPVVAPLRQDLIVLLPDADGSVGRAVVSNLSGTIDLTDARAATRVSANQAPSPSETLSEEEVRQKFGNVLGGLPPAPRHFTVYFKFESEALTEESRARVPEILQAVRDRAVPDVAIIGHTDTTGNAARNVQLALRRANTVRALLAAAQIDQSAIEVRSHGEADPAVPTRDEVFEPRNRRVEITVR